MTPLAHATLSLADSVLSMLEFMSPTSVHYFADKANIALEAAGFPELKMGDEEVARRKRLAVLRSKGRTALRSAEDAAQDALEAARDTARVKRQPPSLAWVKP